MTPEEAEQKFTLRMIHRGRRDFSSIVVFDSTHVAIDGEVTRDDLSFLVSLLGRVVDDDHARHPDF